jgi:regulator of sigma E protease
MLTVLVFIIILGLLIFVHELGHFLVARRSGIRVDEFGFGFPPRIAGIVRDKKTGKINFILGSRRTRQENTVYSLNWIPLGGFVRIKGEEGGSENEPDSFSGKPAWTRIKVLAAGVLMNFLLGWILLSIVFMIGAPQAADSVQGDLRGQRIQISQVVEDSPADAAGLKIGDEISGCQSPHPRCEEEFSSSSDLQEVVADFKGKELVLSAKRGKDIFSATVVPRADYPENQGPLGVSLVETVIVSFPWHEAIVKGLIATLSIIALIFSAIFDIVRGLLGAEKVVVDIAGPVGIAYLTKQVTYLGLVYIMQFAALLSINLGIINGLPFPALDGGRIIFIAIEKIKGSPVSRKVENFMHTVGFALLIALMILVTFRDIIRFEVFEKIKVMF